MKIRNKIMNEVFELRSDNTFPFSKRENGRYEVRNYVLKVVDGNLILYREYLTSYGNGWQVVENHEFELID